MPKLFLVLLLALTIFGSCAKRESQVVIKAAIADGTRLLEKRSTKLLEKRTLTKVASAAERNSDREALLKIAGELEEHKLIAAEADKETKEAAGDVRRKVRDQLDHFEEIEGAALATRLEAESTDDIARIAKDETLKERCKKALYSLPKTASCTYMKSFKDERRAPTDEELGKALAKKGLKCLLRDNTPPELKALKQQIETFKTVQEIMNAGSAEKMLETAIVKFACN